MIGLNVSGFPFPFLHAKFWEFVMWRCLLFRMLFSLLLGAMLTSATGCSGCSGDEKSLPIETQEKPTSKGEGTDESMPKPLPQLPDMSP